MERRARLRALLALMAWLAMGALWPGVGADYVHLRQANLVLSAAAALVVLARHRGILLDARRELLALASLAAVSVAVYTNMFSYRVHYHEVTHYYLGAKYFKELSYGTLYTAIVRADAERHAGAPHALEARDLTGTGALVPAEELLARSQPVKDAFTAARWADFQRDLAVLHDRLGDRYPAVLRDHGYNASPLWAAIGGALANLVPAGHLWGIRALSVLDPLLLAATFAAVAWTFGTRAVLLALIHFCVIYGATFEWVGGAFLRYMWFAAVVLAACAFERGRAAAGGALLGFAAALRVFPAFFMAAIVLGAVAAIPWTRIWPRDAGRALAGFVATAVALVLLTALVPPGLEAWPAFGGNIARHRVAPMANLIGLGSAASVLLGLSASRVAAVALPLAAVVVALAARTRALPGAAALGILLVFAGLDLTAYYYAMLVVLTLTERDRPLVLAGAFGVESASYALALLEGSTAFLYGHRSLLLLVLLAATCVRPLRATLGRRRAPA